MISKWFFSSLVLFSTYSYSGVKYTDFLTGQIVNVSKIIDTENSVLLFVGPYCPCIKNALEKLKDIIGKNSKEYRFIAINVQKIPSEDIKEIFRIWNLGIPIVSDSNSSLTKKFEITAMGTAIVLKNGKLLYRGGIQDEKESPLLSRVLLELKTQNTTQVKFDLGLGCTIEI